MVLTINQLKEIRVKISKIEDIKKMIYSNLDKSNEIIVGCIENIISDVNNNMEIDRGRLYSIYDFNDESMSKEYIINNFKFITNIKSMINFSVIDLNNYEGSFSMFVDKLNTYIVNQLNINNDCVDLYYYDEDFIKYINCDNFDRYLWNLNNIYCFYYSLNKVIEDLNIYC